MNELISIEYWEKILSGIVEWLVNVLPSLVLLFVLTFVALKVFRFLIKRLSNFILNRAYKNATIDYVEAEKRIKTLMGILLGIGKILIWATAIMVLMNKFPFTMNIFAF